MAKRSVIFFDVGNTLLFPNRDRILAPLRDRGVIPSLEQWLKVERETKPEFDAAVQGGAKVDHGYWWVFYSHLLQNFGIGSDDRLRDVLVQNTQNSANWDQIRPGTREALMRIREIYGTAVISNSDGKIAKVLNRCGIADCFQSITDSGIVGYEKPHSAIFEAALNAMRALPEESLYVGDLYSVDYLGARNAGMQAILFDVAAVYDDQNLPRVESLEELRDWLKQ